MNSTGSCLFVCVCVVDSRVVEKERVKKGAKRDICEEKARVAIVAKGGRECRVTERGKVCDVLLWERNSEKSRR